jgi:hypothetical protein
MAVLDSTVHPAHEFSWRQAPTHTPPCQHAGCGSATILVLRPAEAETEVIRDSPQQIREVTGWCAGRHSQAAAELGGNAAVWEASAEDGLASWLAATVVALLFALAISHRRPEPDIALPWGPLLLVLVVFVSPGLVAGAMEALAQPAAALVPLNLIDMVQTVLVLGAGFVAAMAIAMAGMPDMPRDRHGGCRALSTSGGGRRGRTSMSSGRTSGFPRMRPGSSLHCATCRNGRVGASGSRSVASADMGRTGTALACLAVLGGVVPGEAIAWVRANYCPKAVETDEQEAFVAGLIPPLS